MGISKLILVLFVQSKLLFMQKISLSDACFDDSLDAASSRESVVCIIGYFFRLTLDPCTAVCLHSELTVVSTFDQSTVDEICLRHAAGTRRSINRAFLGNYCQLKRHKARTFRDRPLAGLQGAQACFVPIVLQFARCEATPS
jgi:hypothetical protein